MRAQRGDSIEGVEGRGRKSPAHFPRMKRVCLLIGPVHPALPSSVELLRVLVRPLTQLLQGLLPQVT